ncbi:hypothetical protein [uncultured Psychroserpens sp.]|uniref:hypothetical protein n=1 Tax=uncultured Psychroserpens sp. TaxID=255436 RepID=UPI0026197D73|nr:hypothetical protein [uncultured Psychroserpens sp.]
MSILGCIAICVVGFLLTFLDDKNKFNLEFYKGLNLNQLEDELISVLDEILEKHHNNSKFTSKDFSNFELFDDQIANYKMAIIEKNGSELDKLSEEFSGTNKIPGRFHMLSKNNGWQKEFDQINQRFLYIFSAFANYYQNTH